MYEMQTTATSYNAHRVAIAHFPCSLTCKAAKRNFSSSALILAAFVALPLAVTPAIPVLLLPLLPPALLLVTLLPVPLALPWKLTPNGFVVGPLHDANRLNKCRLRSLDNNVVQLSTALLQEKRKRKKILKLDFIIVYYKRLHRQRDAFSISYESDCLLFLGCSQFPFIFVKAGQRNVNEATNRNNKMKYKKLIVNVLSYLSYFHSLHSFMFRIIISRTHFLWGQ